MMGLPLGFAQPLVLLGLLSLPVLWWLLRLIPPRPKRVEFPPTRLLFDITPKEDTPARTPWWLTALRLTLAALVILAAAGPLWNPPVTTSSGAAAVALLIDDGWASAAPSAAVSAASTRSAASALSFFASGARCGTPGMTGCAGLNGLTFSGGPDISPCLAVTACASESRFLRAPSALHPSSGSSGKCLGRGRA